MLINMFHLNNLPFLGASPFSFWIYVNHILIGSHLSFNSIILMDFDGSSDGSAGSFIPSQMIAPMADEPRVPYNRSLK